MPFQKGDIIKTQFETMTSGGACKGTPEGMKSGAASVFAPLAAPGDLARVRVESVVKRYVNATLIDLIKPSPYRAAPPCPIFDECGGCDWQHLSYAAQIEQSDEMAAYAMKRLGNYDSFEHILEKTVACPAPYGYRVRGDMAVRAVGAGIEFGFKKKKSRKIAETVSCPVMKPALSAALPFVRQALAKSKLAKGEDLRVRVVLDETQGLVAAIPVSAALSKSGSPAGWIIDPENASIESVNDFPKFFTTAGDWKLAHSPLAFTQVNPEMNRILIDYVRASLKAQKRDVVLELYSGIGNFTIPIAPVVSNVIAVESFAPARENSKTNAQKGGLDNIEHLDRTALRACRDIHREGRRIDKLLADPPREGMGEKVCAAVSKIAPGRIVYVSCQLDSLCRDIRDLTKEGYVLRALTPFDMFPQTWRKEYLAVLDL